MHKKYGKPTYWRKQMIITTETRDAMLKTLRTGTGVAVAQPEHFETIPSIHDLKSGENDAPVRHIGFGFFEGAVDGTTFSFDGGGQMRRDDGGKVSWCPVSSTPEVLVKLGFDIPAMIAELENLD